MPSLIRVTKEMSGMDMAGEIETIVEEKINRDSADLIEYYDPGFVNAYKNKNPWFDGFDLIRDYIDTLFNREDHETSARELWDSLALRMNATTDPDELQLIFDDLYSFKEYESGSSRFEAHVLDFLASMRMTQLTQERRDLASRLLGRGRGP
jgi:hypothetical protein